MLPPLTLTAAISNSGGSPRTTSRTARTVGEGAFMLAGGSDMVARDSLGSGQGKRCLGG